MRMCETIEGPDSEELLSELLRLYGDRPVIKFHRAVMNNDIASVTERLGDHPEWIESTLIPVAAHEEVAKCNDMDYDAFLEYPGVVPQASNYPVVQQFVSGLTVGPNELYTRG
jgi:ATP phosphoribosyltransferase regulatory subunit HisZ